MAGNVVDYGFYLIQRGEAGHLRGCYLNEYQDSGGIETIGYGTVTRPGYNHLGYRSQTITEQQAVDLAKEEMAYKINEKCRTKFKDFDNLLPCYQAAILDTTYQGNWGAIQNAMNEHDMHAVYAAITNNPNRERAAVRGRAIEMGMLIEQVKEANPNADPKMVADSLAKLLIEHYAHLNGTDCALTRDELALLYRSCMAAYGVEVSEAEIEQFALSYDNVAVGMCGIGSSEPAAMYAGVIPQGPSYDGSYSPPYLADNSNYGGYSSGYNSGSGGYDYPAPVPFLPAEIGPNRFEPDSKSLQVSTSDVTPNFSSRNGQKPQMIVLHTTESPSYGSTKATFQSRGSNVSAHYVIDRDGTIHQFLPEGYSAWHAGRSNFPPLGITGCCNSASIGIEIQRAPGEPLTPEQIASSMALVKDIQERQNIPPENVVAHSDIAPGRKTDPGADFPWMAFAREGLSTMNHLGVGGVHAEHYDSSLNNITSAQCAYYNKSDYPTTTQIAALDEEQRKTAEREGIARAERERLALAQREAELRDINGSTLLQTLSDAEKAGQAELEALASIKLASNTSDTAEDDTPSKDSESNDKSSSSKKKSKGGKKKSSGIASTKDDKDTNDDKSSTDDKSSDRDGSAKKPVLAKINIGTKVADKPEQEEASKIKGGNSDRVA